jgi:hypothetical protein
MVNQEKVRLMAQAESYRRREKRRALKINQYSKGTYVSLQVVKSLIFCTVGAAVLAIMGGIYHGENLLAEYDMSQLTVLLRNIAAMYAAALCIAGVISCRSYSRRYSKARSSAKRYYLILRKINHYNEKERRRLAGQSGEKEGKQG